MKTVADHVVLRTDADQSQTLEGLCVLIAERHPCKRAYAHDSWGVCTAGSDVLTGNMCSLAADVRVTRPWQREHGECRCRAQTKPSASCTRICARRCTTPHDIRRCVEFALCPASTFHLRWPQVEDQRVQVHERNEDSPICEQAREAVRDYCSLDTQRCWGVGFLLGSDCEEAGRLESETCVPDALVLPLLSGVYSDTNGRMPETPADFADRLAALREQCPRAFTQGYGQQPDGQPLFQHVLLHLTRPYAWKDTSRRQL